MKSVCDTKINFTSSIDAIVSVSDMRIIAPLLRLKQFHPLRRCLGRWIHDSFSNTLALAMTVQMQSPRERLRHGVA
jgi:hypothetical protein